MQNQALIQGRPLSAPDLAQIRTLLLEHPLWHRTRLSRELCELWDWRNEAGRLKDMACRALLLKLEARELIGLPPRQRASVNGTRNRRRAEIAHDVAALEAELNVLRPLRVEPVASGSPQRGLFRLLLQRYHYLGHRNCVGENLKYLVCAHQGRPLACLLFGSAAWRCQPRDAFIGWSDGQRQRHLRFLCNNTRFLILPWVRVRHLASHVLSLITRRLSGDWQAKYGHPILLVETFVERERFAGTCYQAAGWMGLGATTGRGRNSTGLAPQGPVKQIYLQALSAPFRQWLCA
jgi:hypothetical protein